MLVKKENEVEQKRVEVEGARGVYIRWLISEPDGAPNFAMRKFTIEPDGHTPYHSHDWEHEVYVLEGEGAVLGEEREKPLGPGSLVFVPAREMHCFKNTATGPFKFLCVVPKGAK